MCCQNGIPSDAAGTTDVAGKMISEIWGEDAITPEIVTGDRITRAKDVINFFFKTKAMPIEVGIAVAGVWCAESGINTKAYNRAEKNNGYAFRDKHAPDARTFKYNGKTYYYDQATMMKFGYGKGVAQWSWDRNLKFRDWYNSSNGVKTDGITRMDDDAANITGTSVTTQTAFAWEEMQKRTGEFLTTVNGIITATDLETFQKNIIILVDAVLRGYENGSVRKMASTTQIDKYTWSGGYSGSMKKRVSSALGIAEAIKNDSEYSSSLIFLQ
jgi:hypothetical protein